MNPVALTGAILLFAFASVSLADRPRLVLGASDGVALDQPRIAIELIETPAQSLGPATANTFILDTGSERILAAGSAVNELTQAGYQTEGTFLEQGISGFSEFDVSAAYRVEVRGDSGVPFGNDDVRILSDPVLDLGGFNGVAGMPVMVGRVVTVDMSVWSNGGLGLMGVDFGTDLPPGNGNRFCIPLVPVGFPVDAEPPFSTHAPIPFLKAIVEAGSLSALGDFVLDTGAQITIISSKLGFRIGLDANGNGSLLDEAVGTVPIGGIAGQINAPVLAIDGLAIPTEEGTDLVWTNLQVIVLDIDPRIDGVLAMDLLTSGWLEALFGGDDGYVQAMQIDFRSYPDDNGTLCLDLTPGIGSLIEGTGFEDSDGDGIDDCWERLHFSDLSRAPFLEYAFGVNPLEPGPLPAVSISRSGSGSAIIRYRRNRLAPHLVYTVQVSSTMEEGSWTELPDPPMSVRSIDLCSEEVSIAIVLPASDRFVRVQVSAPPM